MRVTLVGRDIAPSRAFELVKNGLIEKGVEVSAHLGHGSPLASTLETIRNDVQKSNLVLLGISSSQDLAKEEVFAAREAAALKIPYGFYADIPGVASRGRAWFASVQKDARFLFVFLSEEIEECRAIFPSAEIIPAGNPILENVLFYSNSYEEMRNRLGVAEYELLAYCTADKNLERNKIHFRAVTDAISQLISRKLWKVFFMLHPGDRNPASVYQESTVCDGFSGKIVSGGELNCLDVVKACDIMLGSASTSEYEAAIMRKPVVTVLSQLVKEKLVKQYGTDRWYPCEIGIAWPVTSDTKELAAAISDLVFGNGFGAMRARQKQCFPVPKVRGAVVNTMVEYLLKFRNPD